MSPYQFDVDLLISVWCGYVDIFIYYEYNISLNLRYYMSPYRKFDVDLFTSIGVMLESINIYDFYQRHIYSIFKMFLLMHPR